MSVSSQNMRVATRSIRECVEKLRYILKLIEVDDAKSRNATGKLSKELENMKEINKELCKQIMEISSTCLETTTDRGFKAIRNANKSIANKNQNTDLKRQADKLCAATQDCKTMLNLLMSAIPVIKRLCQRSHSCSIPISKTLPEPLNRNESTKCRIPSNKIQVISKCTRKTDKSMSNLNMMCQKLSLILNDAVQFNKQAQHQTSQRDLDRLIDSVVFDLSDKYQSVSFRI
ncbi:hypothetical protein GJ496_000440 [Pomphorhynchus laevis]|nr:hypothetical protein GJ496_000440 [Pomphorhynchus laevis]